MGFLEEQNLTEPGHPKLPPCSASAAGTQAGQISHGHRVSCEPRTPAGPFLSPALCCPCLPLNHTGSPSGASAGPLVRCRSGLAGSLQVPPWEPDIPPFRCRLGVRLWVAYVLLETGFLWFVVGECAARACLRRLYPGL